MICSAILALAFGIASVAGGPSIPRGRYVLYQPCNIIHRLKHHVLHRNCGTYIDDQTIVAKEMAFKLHQVAPGSLSPLSASSPKLNVYWHVISKDDTLEGGNVTYVQDLTVEGADAHLCNPVTRRSLRRLAF